MNLPVEEVRFNCEGLKNLGACLVSISIVFMVPNPHSFTATCRIWINAPAVNDGVEVLGPLKYYVAYWFDIIHLLEDLTTLNRGHLGSEYL